MILMTYSYSKVIIGVLFVSLILLLLAIAYKKFLAYLGKGRIIQEDYCVLYSLEEESAKGEIEIYFTTETSRNAIIELLNEDFSLNTVIKEGEFSEGGHIVRFDTTPLKDGIYFYVLRTDNQKTMKRIQVKNQ